MKGILINFVERLLSREFVLLIAATALLCFKFLTPEIWLTCALAFISARTLLKFRAIDGGQTGK